MMNKKCRYIKYCLLGKVGYYQWLYVFIVILACNIANAMVYMRNAFRDRGNKLYFWEYSIQALVGEINVYLFYPIIVLFIALQIYKINILGNLVLVKNHSRKEYFFINFVNSFVMSALLITFIIVSQVIVGFTMHMSFSTDTEIFVSEVVKHFCTNISSKFLWLLWLEIILTYIFYLASVAVITFLVSIKFKSGTLVTIIMLAGIMLIRELHSSFAGDSIAEIFSIIKNIGPCKYYHVSIFWKLKNILFWIIILTLLYIKGQRTVSINDLDALEVVDEKKNN